MKDCDSPIADDPQHPFSKAALRRSDNQVVVCVGGDCVSPANQPQDVSEIALTTEGLYCCTKNGQLLSCAEVEAGWRVEPSIANVSSVFRLASGELGVVSGSQVFVRHGVDQFSVDAELTEWLKPGRRRFRLSSRTKRLAVLSLCLAAVLLGGRHVWKQFAKRELLFNQSQSVTYRHELDAERESRPVKEPGWPWLTSALGFNPFRRAERLMLEAYDEEADDELVEISRLSTLRHLELRFLNNHVAGQPVDITPVADLAQLESLQISGQIQSLQPLARLKQLKELWLQGAEVIDTSRFPHLPQLEALQLPACFELRVARDLRHLRTLSGRASSDLPEVLSNQHELQHLRLSCNEGLDLRPIGKLTKLESLNVYSRGKFHRLEESHRPLDWISQLTKLKRLELRSKLPTKFEPTQLTPLAELKELRSLTLPMGSKFDVDLLRKLPKLHLEHVSIGEPYMSRPATIGGIYRTDRLCLNLTNAKSIEPFKDLMQTINELDISGTDIRDIASIRDFPNIRYLRIRDTLVDDFSPIGDLPDLVELNVSGTKFDESDLQLIKNRTSLTTLALARTTFSSVASLTDFRNLEKLDLSYTRTSDVSQLDRLLDLEELKLSGCDVRDISALRWLLHLQDLKLDGTSVSDIRSLAEHRFSNLDLHNTPITDLGIVERIMKHSRSSVHLRLPDGRILSPSPD